MVVVLLIVLKTKNRPGSSCFKISLQKSWVFDTVTVSYVSIYLLMMRHGAEWWAKIVLEKPKANLGAL